MTKVTTDSARSGAVGAAKLGDTELVLLSGGAKRDDRMIEIPPRIKAGPLQRAIGNLLKRGLVEEVEVARDQPAWREQDDRRFSLRITDAGFEVIGIEPAGVSGTSRALRPAMAKVDAIAPEVARSTPSFSAPDRPREGSKGALVVGLLSRPGGATLDQLIEATGWLPHTTRAALTGLRQRGFAIARVQSQDGRSLYRIEVEEPKPIRGSRAGGRRTAKVGASAEAGAS